MLRRGTAVDHRYTRRAATPTVPDHTGQADRPLLVEPETAPRVLPHRVATLWPCHGPGHVKRARRSSGSAFALSSGAVARSREMVGEIILEQYGVARAELLTCPRDRLVSRGARALPTRAAARGGNPRRAHPCSSCRQPRHRSQHLLRSRQKPRSRRAASCRAPPSRVSRELADLQGPRT